MLCNITEQLTEERLQGRQQVTTGMSLQCDRSFPAVTAPVEVSTPTGKRLNLLKVLLHAPDWPPKENLLIN